MRKRFYDFVIFQLISIFSLCACSNTQNNEDELKVGDERKILKDVKYDYENAFFDDFINGVNFDSWTIGSGAWGSGNGGVIPENVFYTEDGVLILRGNGMYYSKNEIKGVGQLKDGKNTGSVIVSKFKTRPGHYEVKMKPLARLGACSAFWTYTNRPSLENEDNDNHEIDIELPGGKTNNAISFKNVLNTNYVTEIMNTSNDINISSISDGKIINVNDGKFHTFGFDWYTDPGMIVYFVDDIVSNISTTFIPNLESHIWLGNWFPNNSGFVGESLFETDYMLVDYVSYIPFLNQSYESWDAEVTVGGALENQYPKTPIILEDVNLIANGDFEYFSYLNQSDNYGFIFSSLADYSSSDSLAYLEKDVGYQNSCAAHIKSGGYIYTSVDSIYENLSHNFSFIAKSNSDNSRVIIRYLDASEQLIDREIIRIDSQEFKQYSLEINPPKDCYSLMIQMYTSGEGESDFIIDNLCLTRNF